MKTPKFWRDENTLSFLFYPLSLIYAFFRWVHVVTASVYRAENLKVFCVGNITAGGSGKTPIAIKIGKILKGKKIKFAYLSKGYKGSIKEFTKVDCKKHSAREVGDEPLLLAEVADTFICKDRKKSLKNLSNEGKYQVIVMDDGFQNPSIFKDKNIVVIDGEYGIGNGEMLPSGPLRESLKSAVKRTSFFVIMGQDKQNLEERFLNNGIKVVRAYVEEKDIPKGDDKYVAFCGLGRPEKFFNSLRKAGYNIVEQLSYDDHYMYDENDYDKLVQEANKHKAKLITTKKDWVKFSVESRKAIGFLDIDIEFYNNDEFMELLINE